MRHPKTVASVIGGSIPLGPGNRAKPRGIVVRSSNASGTARFPHSGVVQLVARWAHNPKVDGSNPSPATETRYEGVSGHEQAVGVSALRTAFRQLQQLPAKRASAW